MDLANAWIPYGGYWCTPFSKWQMSSHPVESPSRASTGCAWA
jgi:hypothetical protein